MRIESREKCCSGRAASSRIIELTEFQTVLCQGIKVRSRDLSAIAGDVRESHIIDHDHDNVGTIITCFIGFLRSLDKEWYEAQQEYMMLSLWY